MYTVCFCLTVVCSRLSVFTDAEAQLSALQNATQESLLIFRVIVYITGQSNRLYYIEYKRFLTVLKNHMKDRKKKKKDTNHSEEILTWHTVS